MCCSFGVFVRLPRDFFAYEKHKRCSYSPSTKRSITLTPPDPRVCPVAVMSSAAFAVPRHPRLSAAIEAALAPCGVLRDLSRLIADYARAVVRWDVSCPDVLSGAVVV